MRESEAIDGRHIIIIHTTRRPAFRRRRTTPPSVAPRLTPILYHTTQKQTNKTLKFPAADGFRITSPRILPNGERIRWNSHHTPVVTRRWSEVHHVQHHVLYHFPKFDGFFY